MHAFTAILRHRHRNLPRLIRTFASWLLVLCFVLPLSYCAPKAGVHGEPAAKAITWTGVGIATEAVRNMRGWDVDKMPMVLSVAVVFFVPALCLGLGALRHAAIVAACAGPSGYCLWIWVFVIGSPRYGGILAVLCWVLLAGTSAATLIGAAGRRRRRGPATT